MMNIVTVDHESKKKLKEEQPAVPLMPSHLTYINVTRPKHFLPFWVEMLIWGLLVVAIGGMTGC